MSSSTIQTMALGIAVGVALSGIVAGAFYLGRVSQDSPRVLQNVSENAAPLESANNEAKTEQKTEVVEPPVPLSEEAAFAKEFENFLNGFLKELSRETLQYKKDRRILKEAVDPFNLIGTENAEQSYRVFKEEIGPLLKSKAGRVMSVFERADKTIEGILADKPAATKEKLMETWKSVEKEHMNQLLDFFEAEDRLIEAHEELLKFYFVHSKLYTVDMDNGKIVFENEKYRAQEAAILDRIQKVKSQGKKKGS